MSKQAAINRKLSVLLRATCAGERRADASNLFLAVLQHVLVLGEFFLLLAFDAFGLVSEPAGVLLLQPLNRLLLLPLQVLHLLVVLSLLTLEDRREPNVSVYITYITY